MPIEKYFKGKGQDVMDDMKGRYGEEGGKRAFYATANARGMNPGESGKPAAPKKKRSIGDRIMGMAGKGQGGPEPR